jgi:hypothetical protein
MIESDSALIAEARAGCGEVVTACGDIFRVGTAATISPNARSGKGARL